MKNLFLRYFCTFLFLSFFLFITKQNSYADVGDSCIGFTCSSGIPQFQSTPLGNICVCIDSQTGDSTPANIASPVSNPACANVCPNDQNVCSDNGQCPTHQTLPPEPAANTSFQAEFDAIDKTDKQYISSYNTALYQDTQTEGVLSNLTQNDKTKNPPDGPIKNLLATITSEKDNLVVERREMQRLHDIDTSSRSDAQTNLTQDSINSFSRASDNFHNELLIYVHQVQSFAVNVNDLNVLIINVPSVQSSCDVFNSSPDKCNVTVSGCYFDISQGLRNGFCNHGVGHGEACGPVGYCPGGQYCNILNPDQPCSTNPIVRPVLPVGTTAPAPQNSVPATTIPAQNTVNSGNNVTTITIPPNTGVTTSVCQSNFGSNSVVCQNNSSLCCTKDLPCVGTDNLLTSCTPAQGSSQTSAGQTKQAPVPIQCGSTTCSTGEACFLQGQSNQYCAPIQPLGGYCDNGHPEDCQSSGVGSNQQIACVNNTCTLQNKDQGTSTQVSNKSCDNFIDCTNNGATSSAICYGSGTDHASAYCLASPLHEWVNCHRDEECAQGLSCQTYAPNPQFKACQKSSITSISTPSNTASATPSCSEGKVGLLYCNDSYCGQYNGQHDSQNNPTFCYKATTNAADTCFSQSWCTVHVAGSTASPTQTPSSAIQHAVSSLVCTLAFLDVTLGTTPEQECTCQNKNDGATCSADDIKRLLQNQQSQTRDPLNGDYCDPQSVPSGFYHMEPDGTGALHRVTGSCGSNSACKGGDASLHQPAGCYLNQTQPSPTIAPDYASMSCDQAANDQTLCNRIMFATQNKSPYDANGKCLWAISSTTQQPACVSVHSVGNAGFCQDARVCTNGLTCSNGTCSSGAAQVTDCSQITCSSLGVDAARICPDQCAVNKNNEQTKVPLSVNSSCRDALNFNECSQLALLKGNGNYYAQNTCVWDAKYGCLFTYNTPDYSYCENNWECVNNNCSGTTGYKACCPQGYTYNSNTAQCTYPLQYNQVTPANLNPTSYAYPTNTPNTFTPTPSSSLCAGYYCIGCTSAFTCGANTSGACKWVGGTGGSCQPANTSDGDHGAPTGTTCYYNSQCTSGSCSSTVGQAGYCS